MPKEKSNISDKEYFDKASLSYVDLSNYDIKPNKHNVIVERYPKLEDNEQYIFVGTHVCPEDIETILGVIDRNAHLVLGSIDSLQHNKDIFLLWLLNGIIPFDILDKGERKDLIPKMERVLKTNSILIFPEGSHNLSPNKIINHLYDGPVNLAFKTNKKIVVVSYLRDNENNCSYMDFSNPIDVSKINADIDYYYPGKPHNEKYMVKSKTEYIRDVMATGKFFLMSRHFKELKREDYVDIEEDLRKGLVEDSFKKLGWRYGVNFNAEYLTKKTPEDLEYIDDVMTISNLELNTNYLKNP